MPSVPTLYHGTDARVVNMSKEERNSYLNHCKVVTGFLWSVFKPFMEIEDFFFKRDGVEGTLKRRKIERYKEAYIEKFGECEWCNFFEKLQMVGSKEEGSESYQYESFYLATSKERARNYARRAYAGGEQGLIAYHLIKGFENLGWNHDVTPIKASIDSIKSFANGEAQPVIIPFENLDVDFLQTETGGPLNLYLDYSELPISVRYTKECEISLQNAEYVRLTSDNRI